MKVFEELDPMHPQDNNYIELLMEMDQHDVHARKIYDTNDIESAYSKVTKTIPLSKETDPMKYHKRTPKREELFRHEIFGNNYRMFGLEKPFDIDELPWR